jgi:hypothetical protein
VAGRFGAGQVHNLGDDLSESGAWPGLRVLSRSRPSTPYSAYRACQRQTAGRLTLARCATSCTGKRSAPDSGSKWMNVGGHSTSDFPLYFLIFYRMLCTALALQFALQAQRPSCPLFRRARLEIATG